MSAALENSIRPRTRAEWRRSLPRNHAAGSAAARKPETQIRRVEETARLAAENIRANQWKK